MVSSLGRRAFISGLAASAFIGACATPAVSARPTPRLRRIGWLTSNTSVSAGPDVDIWRAALRELGYVEDRDIAIEFRAAENVRERLPGIAAELRDLPVDLLVAQTGEAAIAATQATITIPVVFVLVPDPVALGLVASLARPGGNATGTSTLTRALTTKKLELLKDIVPGLTRLAVLWNAHNFTSMSLVLRETEEVARALELSVDAFGVNNADELDAALAAIAARRPQALLALPVASNQRSASQVTEMASNLRLPALYSEESFARAGGLVSLGPNYPALHLKAARLADKILKGASPADLPVEQATQFDLIVNLPVASRLGLRFPDRVLAQATEVIR